MSRSIDVQSNPLIPAFAPSIDPKIEQLIGLPSPEWFPPNSLLLHQNEELKSVRIIMSGIVRLVSSTPNNEDMTLGLRSSGSWLGASEALIGIPAVSSVTTVTRCSISTIPAAEFTKFMSLNPKALRRFVLWLCRENVVQYTQAAAKAAPAEQRLLRMREETTNSCWQTIDPSTVMKKYELAHLLDITPEHFSRLNRRTPLLANR